MYTDKKADIHMFLKLLSGIKHKENSELVQLIVAFPWRLMRNFRLAFFLHNPEKNI